jgi:hypothetical protein
MPRYRTGAQIHAGDRVRYDDNFARIVFVSNGDQFESMPGYDDRRGQDAGILICDDDGATKLLNCDDQKLEFVRR